MDINDYVIDEKIRWSDRIANAFQFSIRSLIGGISDILMSPIIFFRVLFTPTRKVLDILRAINDNPDAFAQGFGGMPPPMEGFQFPPAPDGESWKAEHDELFGSDEEETA